MEIDSESVCRICLKNFGFKNIFSTQIFNSSNKVFCHEVITNMLSVSVNTSDGLPSKICEKCFQDLSSAYELKLLAEQSHKQLLELVSKVNIKSEEEVIKKETFSPDSLNRENFDSTKENTWLEVDVKNIKFKSEQVPGIGELMKDFTKNSTQGLGSTNGTVKINRKTSLENELCSATNSEMSFEPNMDQDNISYDSECNSNYLIILNKYHNVPSTDHIEEKHNKRNLTLRNVQKSVAKHTKKMIKKIRKATREKLKNPEKLVNVNKSNSSKLKSSPIKKIIKNTTDASVERPKRKRYTSKDKTLSCDICGKLFAVKYLLRRHILTHSGDRPYRCSECPKAFKQKCHFNRHMRFHRGHCYLCECCSLTFRQEYQLYSHVVKHHPEVHIIDKWTGVNSKTFACKDCPKTFKTASRLHIHMTSHTGEKRYACEQCGKRYTQHAGLYTHMKTHTGEKPFSCTICYKRFTQKAAIRIHMRTHTREKPYVCEFCSNGFTVPGNLKRHQITHAICKVKFRQKNDAKESEISTS